MVSALTIQQWMG